MKGKLTINRIEFSQEGPVIRFQVTDVISGEEFIEVAISPYNFAMALTGHAYLDCDFNLHADYVGKRRELKRERIAHPEGKMSFTDQERDQLLAPYCVDGWMANNPSDLGNYHNLSRLEPGFLVTFVRFVEDSDVEQAPVKT